MLLSSAGGTAGGMTGASFSLTRRAALAITAATPLLAGRAMAAKPRSPLIIAHRGASGDAPEHTLAAYTLAITMGADIIEPDLVMTRDGVLIARHENELSDSTDVASHPRFADRRTTRLIDGMAVTGWFSEDFTYDEIATLRARERLPQLRPANTAADGQHPVPTADEVFALANAQSQRLGRWIGVYPEIKHPRHFAAAKLDMETALLAALERAGRTRPTGLDFIQCFETGPLERLRPQTRLPLIQLVARAGSPADAGPADPDYPALISASGLDRLAKTVSGIGPDKQLVLARDSDDALLAQPTALVALAHARGLLVHPWTFRAENQFLPRPLRSGPNPAARGDLAEELWRYFDAGVDAVFSDHSDLAVNARTTWLANRSSAG